MELDMLAEVVVLTFENILFNKCLKLVPLFFKQKWLHLLQLITHLLTVNVNARFTINRRRQGSPQLTIALTDILRTDYERKIEAIKGFFLCVEQILDFNLSYCKFLMLLALNSLHKLSCMYLSHRQDG